MRHAIRWVVPLAGLLVGTAGIRSAPAGPPFLAQGDLVGEITPTTAIVRARLTLRDRPNPGTAETKPLQGTYSPDLPEDVPGAPGRVRIRYGADAALAGARTTAWRNVDERTDFSAQVALAGLAPGARCYYRAECAGAEWPPGETRLGPVGEFHTAPRRDDAAPVTLCVITGQAMRSRDLEPADGPRGFASYVSMAKLRPHFLVSTGDSVYYDNDGILAGDEALAQHHWNRLYALPSVQGLFRVAGGYWEKDDHDYRWDDCWPQQGVPGRGGSRLTDEAGRRLFRQAVPMGDKTYRTFVWGRGLQIWLLEGRDFRAPNNRPDGPEKSIWGAEQRAWLKRTLAESRCRYKLLISPTPLIGPDRGGKGDNHANAKGFRHEGAEFLKWAAGGKLPGLYVIGGDRHWQYHSVDPETGVQEFSCGPISDRHSGGTPGYDPKYHRYHRVAGGFLSVAVRPEGNAWHITFTHHRPDGETAYAVTDP